MHCIFHSGSGRDRIGIGSGSGTCAAFAVTFLLHAGKCAIEAEDRRTDAKRHLLLRCLHARRFKVKRDEAFVFLKQSAIEVEKEEVRRQVKSEFLKRYPPNKKAQVGIEKVYLRRYQIQEAILALRRLENIQFLKY